MSPRPQGAMTLCLIVCKAPFLCNTTRTQHLQAVYTHRSVQVFLCSCVQSCWLYKTALSGPCTKRHVSCIRKGFYKLLTCSILFKTSSALDVQDCTHHCVPFY